MLCGAFSYQWGARYDEVTAYSLCYLLFGNGIRSDRRAQSRQQAAVQGKPKEPSGCKVVGTVRGTKIWAGDCVGVELLKGTHTSPEQGTSVIPPDQKE